MRYLVVSCISIVISMSMSTVSIAGTATITWTANTETDLVGYKLYRMLQACTATGPLQPLLGANGQPVIVTKPGTSYVDSTVPEGNVCYEVTAFDTSNNESGRSIRAGKLVDTIPPAIPSNVKVQ